MSFESVLQDLRYSLRGLRSRPAFTVGVVLTLALGIGANAAMFSIVDRMLFRPPPLLRAPDLMHRVYFAQTFRGVERFNGGTQYRRYRDITNWTTSFERTAQYTTRLTAIGTGADAREMQVGVVSASFSGFFDATPALGRWFTTAEDTMPSGTNVVVLSYPLWETQFGGRADALGASLQIGPLMYTVIGVAPKSFAGLWPELPPAAYVPISTVASSDAFRPGNGEAWWNTYHQSFSSTIVELKPGVSLEAATADLTQAYRRSYLAQLAESPRATPIDVLKPHGVLGSILLERGPNASSFAKVATWVSGVALIVLLIACANVANLLLSRALSRRREIAVRLAMGISRRRLLSQLLTESVLLAALGGGAGMLIAQWGGSVLRAAFLAKGSHATVVSDPRTLVFAGAAALLAGLLTGLAPVFQALGTNLTSDLKSGAREGMQRQSRTRTALLVLQGTLSMLLLVGAGLFVKSLSHVREVPLGYDVAPVATIGLNMRGVPIDSAQKILLLQRLLQTAQANSLVDRAAIMLTIPFWSSWSTSLFVAGIDTVEKLGEFDYNVVSQDYFRAEGTRILRGRGITDADAAGAPRAMVVSESMAKVLWPGRDAIGECIRRNADTMPCTYVVGIAEDIKTQKLTDDAGFFYYLSAAQALPPSGGLVVRTHGDAVNSTETIRKALQRVMPGASYVTVTPMADVLGSQTRSWQLGATMFTLFGGLALILAAIGLYSVIAYNVQQRTHEMGVRVALGAQVPDLVRLVLSQGMRLGVIGIALGGVIALAAARWVKPLLFDESARDPVVYGGVTVVLLAVALVASLVPARRAATVDPNTALRSD
jgi:putative ABC transport system permease protein